MKGLILGKYFLQIPSSQTKFCPQEQCREIVLTVDNLSYKQASVEMSVSYQSQSTGLSSISFSGGFSQQALNGCVAIGTVLSITLLIQAITPLIKACKA